MLAVLHCLRRLQANLTELTLATELVASHVQNDWIRLPITGYWLLHSAGDELQHF